MLSIKLSTSLTCVYTSASIHIQNVASINGVLYAGDSKSSKTVYLADREDPKGQENPVG